MNTNRLRWLMTTSHVTQILVMIGLYATEATFAKRRLKNRVSRLQYFTKNVSKWSARALKVMNVEVEFCGFDAKLMAERNFLIVSNHMSYIDIMILSSVMPCVFVTSVDMHETPFLGPMAEMGGSIFVERRNRGQIDRDIGVMSQALRDGLNVVVYPEGTSTNGQTLLPFKKSLLMSAVESGRDILPVALKYTEVNGQKFGPDVADNVCWYGDMSFAPHLLRVMGLKKLKVHLDFLKPIKVTSDSTRRDLAESAFDAIHEAYFGCKPNEDGSSVSGGPSLTNLNG